MKRFSSSGCDVEVYFDSMVCVSNGRMLGYEPGAAQMIAAGDDGQFAEGGVAYKSCSNRDLVNCNWLIPADSADTLCLACAHNRTVPNLADEVAVTRWKELELAKRYLFYSITRWNLPHPLKRTDDDDGLAFDFLADQTNPDGTVETVITGHANGLITINVAEGDDAEREKRRTELHEPYRTLIGHFRHEVGHYYWDRLVRDAGGDTLERCRALFGDEREDYGEALQRHYNSTPSADWPQNYISTYATAHAWEDFAETWAHYLHMVDALETSGSFGLRTVGYVDNTTHAVDFDPYVSGTVADIVQSWVPVTLALNAINRSMGQPDIYPFTVSPRIMEKLLFIHQIIRAHARKAPSEIEPTEMPDGDASAAPTTPAVPQVGQSQLSPTQHAPSEAARSATAAPEPEKRKSWWRRS